MKHATSPSSAQPSTSKCCIGATAIECGVGPSTSGTWCSTSSRATRTATSSLHRGRDCALSRRCSDQAPTSSGPSNSYVTFTLNLRTLSLIDYAIDSSIFSDTRPQQRQGAQDHQRRSFHQCLEYRTTMPLLSLIYARFLLSFSLSTPRSLVTPDPGNGRGSGYTRGLIRAYLSGRHSLCPTPSHVKT